jgi:hypothetical protein
MVNLAAGFYPITSGSGSRAPWMSRWRTPLGQYSSTASQTIGAD